MSHLQNPSSKNLQIITNKKISWRFCIFIFKSILIINKSHTALESTWNSKIQTFSFCKNSFVIKHLRKHLCWKDLLFKSIIKSVKTSIGNLMCRCFLKCYQPLTVSHLLLASYKTGKFKKNFSAFMESKKNFGVVLSVPKLANRRILATDLEPIPVLQVTHKK